MIEIDIITEAGDWPKNSSSIIERSLGECFAQLKLTAEGDVSVVLADNDFVQHLNKTYRNKDRPTNILSFPQIEDVEHISDKNTYVSFGDLILAYETLNKECENQNKRFEDHLSHLVIHGFLHLLGHDHEEEVEAEKMEALEISILAQLGIKNPYEFIEDMA